MAKGISLDVRRAQRAFRKAAPAGFAPGLSLRESIAVYGSERSSTAGVENQAQRVSSQYEDRLDQYQQSALTRELMAHAAKWLKRQQFTR